MLGLWLIVSPWVFDYGGKSAALTSITVGTLIALLAAIRLASLHNSAGSEWNQSPARVLDYRGALDIRVRNQHRGAVE